MVMRENFQRMKRQEAPRSLRVWRPPRCTRRAAIRARAYRGRRETAQMYEARRNSGESIPRRGRADSVRLRRLSPRWSWRNFQRMKDRPGVRGAPQFGREHAAQGTSRLGAVAASLARSPRWSRSLARSPRSSIPRRGLAELLGSCEGLSAPARCIGASLSRRFSRF